jgi:hypothetical protein
MAFPTIRHCLVCEDIRFERRNLVALLGFYGITPDVEILVKDFALPVPHLYFLFIGGQGEGRFKISLQLLNGEGKSLVTTPESEVVVQPQPKRTNLALGLAGFAFPSPGAYTLRLFVAGESRPYESQFQVLQGSPEDFV